MSVRFGTDGVRGVAGTELTPEVVMALGRAVARVLVPLEGRVLLVGRDTRLSGPLLQAALSAGAAAEGVDVVDLGVLPTPAVAAVSSERGLVAAVISASHNPYPDNGIKLFARGGLKLDDVAEAELEAAVADAIEGRSPPGSVSGPSGAGLGRLRADHEAFEWYCSRVVGALEGRSLDGLRVVLDCANGAAWRTAPQVFRAAGATVVAVLGAEPDGTNINAGCGSTDPSRVASAVRAEGADVGLALDGDADRVIAVDDAGQVVDGDRLLALFARDLQERSRLSGGTVVVTVMTNLGFHLAMEEAGIGVHQTPVGDRHVLSALDSGGWSLGGEQSGHIIFRDLATTGDGVLSGLLLLDLVRRSGWALADLADAVMERLPQVLRNVEVSDLDGLETAEAVWAEVREVEAALGDHGRVLLRPSGTERLVRVMVEAPTEDLADGAARRLEAAVVATLGRG